MFAPTICKAIATLMNSIRYTEVLGYQLHFKVGRLKLFVMLGQLEDLVLVEPIAEALAVERVGLTVDALVVEGLRQRTVYRCHLEGQPAAVTCRVREELQRVACTPSLSLS